jgi:hypothetical protein
MIRCRLLVAAALFFVSTSAGAGPYDPTLRFQSLTTPHFIIHFHQGEEALARRLAAIAERVYAATAERRTDHPRGRIHVVLVDQNDTANGSATVVPRDAIQIDAAPPTGADQIGNTDDWLEYVFTHEFAHVGHLDRSRGWARAARALLGRTALAFPNLSLPLWQIEGVATLVESEAGGGRLHAGDFREVVEAAARADRFEPLDRVSGGLVDWPSGTGWYAYGALFHEFLVDRYGRDRLETLADRTAGRVPYLTAGAFQQVYGKSLGALWREFEAWVRASLRPPDDDRATRLTRLGFLVETPRVDGDGAIWFSASDPRRFPGIYRLGPNDRQLQRITSRFGGTGLTVGRDIVIFDQLEIVRGAGLQGDLYAFDRRGGGVRRLTRGARLAEPDLSPDGRFLAAVQVQSGARRLVVLDTLTLLAAPHSVDASALTFLATLGNEDDVFASPRWSPDAARIAVERRQRKSASEILVIDARLRSALVVATSAVGRNVTPEWTSDGRSLWFASDRDGGPFALYRADVGDRLAPAARALLPPGGARSPTVTADGRVIFVGYTVEGFDLFEANPTPLAATPPDRPVVRGDDGATPPGRIAMRGNDGATPSGRTAVRPYTDTDFCGGGASAFAPLRRTRRSLERRRSAPPATGEARTYRPWSTLVPHGWLPLMDHRDGRWRLGAVVSGTDVLGRHALAADATWALNEGAVGSELAPRGRPDWAASYAYQRWQTTPYAAIQDRTSLFTAVDETAGGLIPVAQRERQIDVGIFRAFRRVRWAQTLAGAVHGERLSTALPGVEREADRSGVRTAWTLVTARQYGYSISPEAGVAVGATGEFFRPAFGADGTADATAVDARVYVPLGKRQSVLAIRAAGAVSRGDVGVRRVFRLGGADGNPVVGAFGSDAISLLRGFEDDVIGGTHVALVNAELRVPLAWPQRGIGTWPIFLRSVHATVFADVGHAWTGASRWDDRKTGLGAELSANVIAGFGLPLTWTVGAAWGHDRSRVLREGREIYVRLGRSF